MESSYGGGSWSKMIPNMQTHSNPTTPSNQSQDHLYLQSQFNQQPFQQQQQFNQPQFQPQTFQSPPPQQQQLQPQPQQQQPQHQQSLASHFHLLHLVENFADAVENGNRDQHFDALVSELNNQFEKCQQLLNFIAGSISSKSMTVEGQKLKLVESEQLLNQRRDLIGKYRDSVEELIKSEP